jgi:hypothetical protein
VRQEIPEQDPQAVPEQPGQAAQLDLPDLQVLKATLAVLVQLATLVPVPPARPGTQATRVQESQAPPAMLEPPGGLAAQEARGQPDQQAERAGRKHRRDWSNRRRRLGYDSRINSGCVDQRYRIDRTRHTRPVGRPDRGQPL